MHWPFTCVSRPGPSLALALPLIREARPGVCFMRLHEPMGSIMMTQIYRSRNTLNGTRPKFVHWCRAGFNLAIFPLAATLLLIAIILICEVAKLGPGLPRAFPNVRKNFEVHRK